MKTRSDLKTDRVFDFAKLTVAIDVFGFLSMIILSLMFSWAKAEVPTVEMEKPSSIRIKTEIIEFDDHTNDLSEASFEQRLERALRDQKREERQYRLSLGDQEISPRIIAKTVSMNVE